MNQNIADNVQVQPVLEMRDVSFSHATKQEVCKHLHLSFVPGACALIGQNGAGKTTILKLLRGLLVPQSGSVCYKGKDISQRSVAQLAGDIGFVFQNPDDQIFESSVLREVMFGLMRLGISEASAQTQARKSLELVGLADKADVNPYDLGLCARKLVCLASILAMDPSVVLLDEPTIAQDSNGKKILASIIKQLVLQNKTVIAVLHDMNFVAQVFDRVVVIDDGHPIFDGSPRDVFARKDVLSRASLDQPPVVKLCEALGYSKTLLTADEFIAHYRSIF
ncbi:energy-coupling factor ABC transporter ATP-binding protein [Fannyhessea vaginae]|uniref:energy-coupling factor ABC transporter ATP-binding protein n=1 Tax=Fannyhessea vaginae TaxID=82135 RepID=UPI003B211EA8